MYFTRYEIRHEYRRNFYEGGDDFNYIPFDTLEDANEYIRTHRGELKATTGESIYLYKVRLYSNYDETELLKVFDEDGNEWTPEKYNTLEVLQYIANKTDISQEQKTQDIYEIAKRYGLVRECRKRGLI